MGKQGYYVPRPSPPPTDSRIRARGESSAFKNDEISIKNTISVNATATATASLNCAEFCIFVNSFNSNNKGSDNGDTPQHQPHPNAHGAVKCVTDKLEEIKAALVKDCGVVVVDGADKDKSGDSRLTMPFGERDLQPCTSVKSITVNKESTGFFSSSTTTKNVPSFDGWNCSHGMKLEIFESGDDAALAARVAKVIDTLSACKAVSRFDVEYIVDQGTINKLRESVRATALENAKKSADKIVAKLNSNKKESSATPLQVGAVKNFVELEETITRPVGQVNNNQYQQQSSFFSKKKSSSSSSGKKAGSAFTLGDDIEKVTLTIAAVFELINNDCDEENNSNTVGSFEVFGVSPSASVPTPQKNLTMIRGALTVTKPDEDKSVWTASQVLTKLGARQQALNDSLAPLLLNAGTSNNNDDDSNSSSDACSLVFNKIPRFSPYNSANESKNVTVDFCVVVPQPAAAPSTTTASSPSIKFAMIYEQLYTFFDVNEGCNLQITHTQTDENKESSVDAALEELSTEAWKMANDYAANLNLRVVGVSSTEEIDGVTQGDCVKYNPLLSARCGMSNYFFGEGGRAQTAQQQKGNSIVSSLSSISGSNGPRLPNTNTTMNDESIRAHVGQRITFEFAKKV